MPRVTDTYELTGRIFVETDKAILFNTDTEDREGAVWIPKSVCEDIRKTDRLGIYEIDLPEYKVAEYGFD